MTVPPPLHQSQPSLVLHTELCSQPLDVEQDWGTVSVSGPWGWILLSVTPC